MCGLGKPSLGLAEPSREILFILTGGSAQLSGGVEYVCNDVSRPCAASRTRGSLTAQPADIDRCLDVTSGPSFCTYARILSARISARHLRRWG